MVALGVWLLVFYGRDKIMCHYKSHSLYRSWVFFHTPPPLCRRSFTRGRARLRTRPRDKSPTPRSLPSGPLSAPRISAGDFIPVEVWPGEGQLQTPRRHL